MDNCPNEEDMACYIDGLLPAAEEKKIEKHLLRCDRFSELVKVTRKIIDQEKALKSFAITF